MKKQLIVNADDFGLYEGVNLAVERSHKNGVLTSTTIMAGAQCTQQAIELAKDMPKLGIGIHLNLTEGKALSQTDKVKCLLDENGEFKYTAGKVALKSMFSAKIRLAIETELTAQIESLLHLGLKPTHFDSHKHVHTFPSIYAIVLKLADKFEIPAIRWPGEDTKTSGSDWPFPSKNGKKNAMIIRTLARVNKTQSSKYIKNDAFYGIAHTGKADNDFWQAVSKSLKPGISEVMVHPGYLEGLDPNKTRLLDERVIEMEALCSENTRTCIAAAGIELINYGDIQK